MHVRTIVIENKIQLVFADGKRLEVDADTLPEEIRHEAMLFGLRSKLFETASPLRDKATGKPASPEERIALVRELTAGWIAATPSWGKVQKPNGGTLLFQALCELYAGKKSATDIKLFLSGKSGKQKVKLQRVPEIAALIAKYKTEMGEPQSGEDLLDELLS